MKLFDFLNGYVEIEVLGAQLERFLNIVIFHNIRIWDIKKEGSIRFSISVKDFKKIKDIGRKTASKIKIKNKVGAPFFIFKYRKRKFLLLGSIFFFISLYSLTAFIWDIEINGYENISYDNILNALNENGLSLGSFRRSIDRLEIEQSILTLFDISFININLKGTRAIVTIMEIPPEIQIEENRNEIKATKTGIIESITVFSGTPLVEVGQVVTKGELLVSGNIIEENFQTQFITYASANILANVNYLLEFSLPRITRKPYFTEKTRTRHSLYLFGNYINFINLLRDFDFYDTIVNRKMLNFGENYPLPIILISSHMKEYELIEVERTEEELEQIAKILIREHILDYFDISVDIIETEVTFTHSEIGLDVYVLITTLEDIAN